MITIPISTGELLDKLSILSIKGSKIKDESKLKLVNTEFDLLHKLSIPYLENDILGLYLNLVEVNSKLWDVEDKLRVLETEHRFEGEFIDLARKVYYLNDERFSIKNQINILTLSEIQEVKEYVDYKKEKSTTS
jgi:hypothetical protein